MNNCSLDPEDLKKQLSKFHSTLSKMEKALASINEGIAWTDEEGMLEWCNEPFESFIGKSKMELYGKKLSELLPLYKKGKQLEESVHPTTPANVRKNQAEEEYEFINDNGTVKLEIRGSAFSYAGEKKSNIFIIRNITKRELMKEKLLQSQKLEAIGSLAAGIAHEINTPVQYITDNLNFLSEGLKRMVEFLDEFKVKVKAQPDNEALKALNTVAQMGDMEFLREEIPIAIEQSLEGAKHIGNIVKSVKEFSHPGSREKSMADINKMLENASTVSKNEWKYHSTIKLELSADMPRVMCFPAEMNQVLLNLIINAAHAIKERQDKEGSSGNGLIRLFTKVEDNWAVIGISDNGTGIPQAIQDRIFDPFFTTKEVGKGTGQGLHLARTAIVERHNGELEFETEAGKGTTFFIKLPIKDLTKTTEQNGAPTYGQKA